MAEYWDIYDHDRELTGRTHLRGERLNPGDYHIVVHVAIFRKDGKLLIQQRQFGKRGWAGKWDVTCGGSALAGENSQTAAMRELEEEIGYEINLENIRPDFSLSFDRGFDDWYLVGEEVDLASLTLQVEEVIDVTWATKEDILALLEQDQFVTYTKGFIEFLFDCWKYSGSIT